MIEKTHRLAQGEHITTDQLRAVRQLTMGQVFLAVLLANIITAYVVDKVVEYRVQAAATARVLDRLPR